MNFEYHRKTLTASDIDHPLVQQALTLLPRAEQAMRDLVAKKITIKKYVAEISEYDEFMYVQAKVKPQKTNPINTMQNKKYSTWREQKWAPIWELVRAATAKAWNTDSLIVIQNKKVVESVYSSGYVKYKDVDGGIGFETPVAGQRKLVPIIAVEDKGGHACSTCFDGVSAQSLRLHRCLPNSYHVFITDNNISVGKEKESEIFSDIDLIVSERGQNRVREQYPRLDHSRWQQVHDGFVDRLSGFTLDHFAKIKTIPSHKQGTLRAAMDTDGMLWNR